MLTPVVEVDEVVPRVAALDIGKAELVCCIRVQDPGHPGRRLQEILRVSSMTRSVTELADRLVELRVQRVVMEATSDYWKPVFYVLEAAGLDPWLVNPRDVKHLPGRPKTDKLDAVWLAKLTERGMLRPSFVPPKPIRRLRDVTRYRYDLVVSRTAEKNRVEKLLEDAGIKLSVVASDIFGVSGRDMMRSMIAGERNPARLAQLARARMRGKISELEEAFSGHFTDHHAHLLQIMLDRIDATNADIARVEEWIDELIHPFDDAVAKFCEIPGVHLRASSVLVAEIGVDMSRFPTPQHLAAWARFAPTTSESAGRPVGRSKTGHGDRYLAAILGEIAVAASKTDTFLGARYRRIAKRRGKQRAIVAVGRSILTIIWHLLSDPDARFIDLGSDYYINHKSTTRQLAQALKVIEGLGFTANLTPAA